MATSSRVRSKIKKAFLDAKSRGVRLKYLTEITNDDISYCKALIKIVDELRHLDGKLKDSLHNSEPPANYTFIQQTEDAKTESFFAFENCNSLLNLIQI